jgi:hypothetical protein
MSWSSLYSRRRENTLYPELTYSLDLFRFSVSRKAAKDAKNDRKTDFAALREIGTTKAIHSSQKTVSDTEFYQVT